MYPYVDRPSSRLPFLLVLGVIVAIVAFGACQLVRGLPALEATTTIAPSTVVGAPLALPLPADGAAAVSIAGLGTLGENAATTQRPIASVAKVMVAYVILKDHPLQPGEQGPTISLTAADEARYVEMILEDQSALPVSAGLELSQYQILQGLLIPSANNFAEILAAWDAGSIEAFVARMNAEARALDMTSTTYVDTSGFASGTVSTAADQLVLAQAAMANPVFAQIVAAEEATLPGIGLVSTTNQILARAEVVGIKTGFTEEAGGNLVFAARQPVGQSEVDIIGVVLGQPTRAGSFDESSAIIDAVGRGLGVANVVSAGSPVGVVDTAWSDPVEVVAGEDVPLIYWPGMTVTTTVSFDEIEAPLDAGAQVGWLDIQLGEQQRRVPIVLAADLPEAAIFWRLSRF